MQTSVKNVGLDTIDAELFERLMISGASNLHANLIEVNNLNVFPVPDGDTGDNMYLTLKGGVEELCSKKGASLNDLACAFKQGTLLNARGNSGVILSQFFAGLIDGIIGREIISLSDFIDALKNGVKRAYGAVAVPVEGTILTVAREGVENSTAKAQNFATIEDLCKDLLCEMQKSLAHTPELLPVLKEAGVIDSGGAGLVYIVEGFCKALTGDAILEEVAVTDTSAKKLDFSKFDENSQMTYGYCTELLLQLQTVKTDVKNFSVDALIEYLSTIGDSIVAFITGTVVKVHVHTLTPYKVLEYCQRYGEFLTVKIENMTLQHSEVEDPNQNSFSATKMSGAVKKERKKFATVTVASGDGIVNTFLEMGADYVINGGQTNNPSSEDFIKAFDAVNADCIFVLPNNGNIILSAKQASSIYDKSEVRVIESKSLGEGYAALSMLDYSVGSADEIEDILKSSMRCVLTGMVTTAVRTTTVNGVNINLGDYIGFTNKEMLVSTTSKIDTAKTLLEKLEVIDCAYLVVVYGKGATDSEREELSNYLNDVYADVEFYEIDGMQDVYDFIFITE
jgi:DAK2 domain fusion protein YloV